MRRLLPTLRACAATGLLLLAGASLAAAPSLEDDSLLALQDAFTRAARPGEAADLHRALIPMVFGRVQRSYAREVDLQSLTAAASAAIATTAAAQGEPADVFKKAVNAALGTLDPYSRYLDPRGQRDLRDDSTGSFGGVGLQVEPADGAVRVLAALPDGPAARAGLQPGDAILRIDDAPLAGMPLADAVARMRGEPGTPVTLLLRKAGGDEVTVALTRDTIRRQLLRWSLEGDVLVLRLSSFSGPVSAELERAVAAATAAGTPSAVVLDLRGNPGGLLREAVRTADAFLAQGEIASMRGRTPGNQRSWQADAAELLAGLPMVVLVDRRSASASELVAAALQEHSRAKVMGQRSFGKGTVQSTYPLPLGALKLTTAHYHGPSGRTVQRIGVGPDIELLPGAVADAATQSVEAHGPGDAEPTRQPEARIDQRRCASAGELPKTAPPDPALVCALAYLRSGSVGAFVSGVASTSP